MIEVNSPEQNNSLHSTPIPKFGDTLDRKPKRHFVNSFYQNFKLHPAVFIVGAILISAILIVNALLVIYVETSISRFRQNLPVEVLSQQRDVALMIEDLIGLERAIEIARVAPSPSRFDSVRSELDAVEARVSELRRSYNFDNLVGASAMHAVMNPIVRDVKIWLADGVYGFPPESEFVMNLVNLRVYSGHRRVELLFAESNDMALSVLKREATNLERFRTSLIMVVIFAAILAVLLVAYVIRQRRSEAAVSAAQQHLRDAVDSIPGGFALFDAEERLLLCNSRYADLYPGVQKQVQAGARFEDMLRAAVASGELIDSEGAHENWIGKRLEQFRNPNEVLGLALANGRYYRVAERRTSDGGIVVISTDISELRRREDDLKQVGGELRHKNVLFDAALDNMGQGLAMFDNNQRLIICNRRYLDMYDLPEAFCEPGVELSQIMDFSAKLQKLTPERAKSFIEHRLAIAHNPREASDQEFLSDGRVINILHRPLPGGGSLATYEDVTLRYKSERELLAAKEEAELASRAKSDFLANVSHELRTPLNAIIGFSEIIKGELFGPVGSPQYREYSADIFDSGTHLLNLINDILDLSKIEAGKLELIEENIDLAEIAQASLRLVQERAEGAGVKLKFEIQPNPPGLFADRRAVKQVLLNLLSNAVKFTEKTGQVTVLIKIAADGGVNILVKDTGIGIAESDMKKAFAPFGQADSALNRKYEGTGLGLPLSKRLIDLHGGALTLESKLGQGTTVAVWFPPRRLIPPEKTAGGVGAS